MEATRAKFRILDKDTYNFDKTGFMMGLVLSQLVVTGAHRYRKPKLVQPGNQTWTTMIQGVRAGGAAIPPYIIFVGKHYINMWYKDQSLPGNWVIGVSENGWTTNTHRVEWLQHFNQHI